VNNRFPKVGVIGAGQLARMMVAPATALGVDLILFAQSADDSAAQIASHVIGDYTNLEALKKFADQCDVITFEHELVPQSVIKGLEAHGVRVYPPSQAFLYSQDKEAMRTKLSEFLSPTWKIATRASDVDHYPVIGKTISGGYDGRGVWKINSQDELVEILKTTSKLLIEEIISFDAEIAVMVARSPHGQATSWTPTETVQEDGICTITVSPAQCISPELAEQAQKLALDIANLVGVVGVMAVEMFVKGEDLYINELAMRPHNSGHWTIDGACTSQFEQHLRAILDLPLGDPKMSAEFAVMGNILGGEKSDMYRPYLHLMARNPELKFHQYKKEVRPGRKIGHVTGVGRDLLQLTIDVQHARDYMSGEIDE
jgi:5-(carboxyamino)imidazole ribonucleotide synthase|tara:strand:- start:10179 stop:11291 length:1113 start_codon:yes stop_codon:yes gene_type:complete